MIASYKDCKVLCLQSVPLGDVPTHVSSSLEVSVPPHGLENPWHFSELVDICRAEAQAGKFGNIKT